MTVGKLKKVIPFSDLSKVREWSGDKPIVQCHGVFDVFHAGHLAYFKSAKKSEDSILVVTVTADKFVNKGPGRPYFNSQVRAEMLAALEVIDFVAVSDFPSAVPAITALKPNFYVKGPDYRDKENDATGAIYEEERAVNAGGGELVFTADEMYSSSTLINKFFNQWTEQQKSAIDSVNAEGGAKAIEKVLEQISKMRVRVIGEPIIDTYVFCAPQNLSSKSPSISAQYLYEENYAGGSLAIANHLADFVEEVELVMTHGNDAFFADFLKQKLDPRVKVKSVVLKDIPTPRKTRFTMREKPQHLFEVTNLVSDQWNRHSPDKFCSLLESKQKNLDGTIIADFGHGLFEGDVLKALQNLEGFIALNAQTNSSNFGYNLFTKHRNFSYLSIDTREARLSLHDRFTAPLELSRRISHQTSQGGSVSVSMTLGHEGAVFFSKTPEGEHYSPAFSGPVIDAVGAGDAFFALTSLFVKSGCSPILVPFVGNIFAGIKTQILGNKYSVSKAQLIKAVNSILK